MARKISVKFNGKTIGTRTTDRAYTHALVLADFNPGVARAEFDKEWREYGIAGARGSREYAIEAQSPTYRYANQITEGARAGYADIAAMTVEAYVAKCHADRLQRLEAFIVQKSTKGALVLSYHGSRDLAFKAQAAASKAHPAYLVLVEPVEA